MDNDSEQQCIQTGNRQKVLNGSAGADVQLRLKRGLNTECQMEESEGERDPSEMFIGGLSWDTNKKYL